MKKSVFMFGALFVLISLSSFKTNVNTSSATPGIVNAQKPQLIDGGYFMIKTQEYHIYYDSSFNVASLVESVNLIDTSVAATSVSGHAILGGVQVTFFDLGTSHYYSGNTYY